MVYLEYNKTKKGIQLELIDYQTYAEKPEEAEELVFQTQSILTPNSSIFPIAQPIETGNELYYCAYKKLPLKTYCFKYDNLYYVFDTFLNKKNILIFNPFNNSLTKKFLNQEKVISQIYGDLEIEKTGNEMSFSNIIIDLSEITKEDLPKALQEIRIWEGNVECIEDLEKCKLLFYGFIDSFTLNIINNKKNIYRMELSIIPPYSLSLKRNLSISGNYEASEIFGLIFEPLINDGFTLKEVPDINKTISVNYFVEPIENIMNFLSNKLNIYWYIDEKKGIYVKDISSLFNLQAKHSFNEENGISGLFNFNSTIQNNDYFNTINVTNARVYNIGYNGTATNDILGIHYPLVPKMKFVKDEEIVFENPIDFNKKNLKRICKDKAMDVITIFTIVINGTGYECKYNASTDTTTMPSSIKFEGEDTESSLIVLKKDDFFKNLVTSFIWKGSTSTATSLISYSMLKYQILKINNSNEIEKYKDFLSDSGICEKTIDLNESWFTKSELIDYCNSLIVSNSNETNEVEMGFDEDYGFNIGDIVSINMPTRFIDGKFIVTQIKERYHGKFKEFNIILKNFDIEKNYIDIFRKSEEEQDEEKYKDIDIVEYSKEKVEETFGVD